MGLGKTVITLTAINELMFDHFSVARVLVIAPLRVAEAVWPIEVQKWDHLKHLRVVKILGDANKRLDALRQDADIYVINRENVQWLVQTVKRWFFDMVVIDELSSFKSPKAQRFRSLRKVRPLITRVVGLTGTPVPNGLVDLWSQIYLLDRGFRLGSTLGAYRDRYFKPGRRNGNVIFEWLPRKDAEEAIYDKLKDLCISMRAQDWLEMPERIDRVLKVQLSAEALKQYAQLERDLILKLRDSVITASNSAVVAGKLQQFAQGAIYTEAEWVCIHDTKLEALEDLLEEANGRPVLVFYWYKHDASRINAWLKLKGFNSRLLNTAKDISDWNLGEIPVLLAHPASAGHGLNLQAGGNIIIWFGLTWSLELYQQANARLYRQGQKESVIVHHLVAAGTIDEIIMMALESKNAGQDSLLSAVKAKIESYKLLEREDVL